MEKKILKRILYAEDEADIRMIAQIALEDIGGFEVNFCNDGKEVLREVDQFCPDLILLDVMMPEMDGLATLKSLQQSEKTKNIPVIFMTAKAQANEIAKYIQLGAIDVITKPFDPMQLSKNIKKRWDSYHGH